MKMDLAMKKEEIGKCSVFPRNGDVRFSFLPFHSEKFAFPFPPKKRFLI